MKGRKLKFQNWKDILSVSVNRREIAVFCRMYSNECRQSRILDALEELANTL